MMNVGFVEASKLFPQLNCLVFHDVDNLLEDDRLLMRCDSRPHHYAFYLSRWGYKYFISFRLFIYIFVVIYFFLLGLRSTDVYGM